jgi:hypothetical protein
MGFFEGLVPGRWVEWDIGNQDAEWGKEAVVWSTAPIPDGSCACLLALCWGPHFLSPEQSQEQSLGIPRKSCFHMAAVSNQVCRSDG